MNRFLNPDPLNGSKVHRFQKTTPRVYQILISSSQLGLHAVLLSLIEHGFQAHFKVAPMSSIFKMAVGKLKKQKKRLKKSEARDT